MKNKIISLAFLCLASFAFISCETELDIDQLGNLGSAENFYNTDEDAEAAITCCYYDIKELYEKIMVIPDLLSDDIWCGGGQKNDNAQREDIGVYTFSSTNELIQSAYEELYRLIYHANLMIENFESHDTEIKQRNLAEAYFFRGFAHFYLGSFFGTAPVVDHLLAKNEYAQPNSQGDALFQQAAKDLKQAVESGKLTSKSTVDRNTPRITQQAAEAFLGKTYIFLKDWNSAATELGKVINSGKYKLYEGAYSELFHPETDFCSEYVLETNNVMDFANFNVSLFHIYSGLRGEFYNWDGVDPALDLASGGYGFFNPTSSLYNAFVAEEGADGYRLNQTIKTYDQLTQTGVSIVSGRTLHGHEGYWSWKRRLLNKDYIVFGLFNVVNDCYMRYAEVLLLAAEAYFMNGNTSEALKCLNEVRERAQIPAKTSITLEDIKTEKRLELFTEGCRWMDLVRWGDAAELLKDNGKEILGFNGDTQTVVVEYTNSSSLGFVAGKHEHLPIPNVEITLNDNMDQNPGW